MKSEDDRTVAGSKSRRSQKAVVGRPAVFMKGERNGWKRRRRCNLLLAFKRCHNYIAGNQGLQKPEAFWELLKVIFCKIEDERSLDSLSFYITNREQKRPDGQLKCKKRMDLLFIGVRTKYSSIFKPAAHEYSFSNWYTPKGNLIGVLRLQF